MFYLACIMISGVDFAYYRVSRAKDWVFVDCGTRAIIPMSRFAEISKKLWRI